MIGLEDQWEADAQAWRERDRRQRSVRLLLMFLLMLLLMDGDEQTQRRRHENLRHKQANAKKQQAAALKKLSPELLQQRQELDNTLFRVTQQHSRFDALKQKNNGENVHLQVRKWAEQQATLEKDEFAQVTTEKSPLLAETPPTDPEDSRKVFHYPWNATGFYRGEWRKVKEDTTTHHPHEETTTKTPSITTKTTKELESTLLDVLDDHHEIAGVYLLPPPLELDLTGMNMSKVPMPATASLSTTHEESTATAASPFLRVTDYSNPPSDGMITLTKQSGRAAFQLYARSVPAMKELSLLDGFVKLYDSNTAGYSTRRDILLRVRGVMIHSIGKLSLVSNARHDRAAFVLSPQAKLQQRRRLLQVWDNDDESYQTVDKIRDDVLSVFSFDELPKDDEWELASDDWLDEWKMEPLLEDPVDTWLLKYISRTLLGSTESEEELEETEVTEPRRLARDMSEQEETTSAGVSVQEDAVKETTDSNNSVKAEQPSSLEVSDKHQEPAVSHEAGSSATDGRRLETGQDGKPADAVKSFSKIVFPFPYVPDDKDGTIRNTKTPAARRMPPREQSLEANAGKCEFEISMNAQEVEWTVGEWRSLVMRHVKEAMQLDPSRSAATQTLEEQEGSKFMPSGTQLLRTKSNKDQALVMAMMGSIHSPNCDFTATLNATAIRTDWEYTTGKAINYSFYMMLTCLAQIVVLLRQLLHTQAQSAATRVSLMCIGWQTVLDALLCLGHIYLSLAMQPLFTAFASVAFFKLLIFCVIEMKYMAIILQARNNTQGANSPELLRRQVAMLHLRFYVALVGTFTAFYYAGESYRTAYILLLYSFWVPQIIQNIITEAKRPLHHYYIYGMSVTRLVAPLYIFAAPNNFLKEVYPDSPTNLFMCELLVFWVAFQTAVLVAQGRYGARFMIPARFLPPKFDYSRPIPPSLLPPGALDSPSHDPLHSPDRNTTTTTTTTEMQSLLSNDSPTRVHTSGVTRNRIKGSRVNRAESMTTETHKIEEPPSPSPHTVDCVICYNPIDVHNRHGYMLAPRDHLFHKDCLVQWMDVKMECPICRTDLPSI